MPEAEQETRPELEQALGVEAKQSETPLAYTGSNGMVPAGLAGLGMLGAGLVLLLRRRRPAVEKH
ncbi:LPXTG cell wall anchor domain-containing protein [Lentzea sp. NPDC005914]|uniref:LPXTG cell wall anchor domain-containing protein n=1 Tax=Lentzea sp. NPDC005914 TaxID=3154572 RepID=UPI00340F45B7